MKYKQLLLNSVLCIATAFFTLWIHDTFLQKPVVAEGDDSSVSASYAGFHPGAVMMPFDFSEASEAALPAVVHIRASIKRRSADNAQPKKNNEVEDMFQNFFGIKPNVLPEQRASGSGVIVTPDGYIVTNNHVIVSNIDGAVADEISVTMSDHTTYKATVVGRDVQTDLAVIKIDASKLPAISFGNSDLVKTGQWALAVGYPLGLDATVTAGIISGIGRSINNDSKQNNTTGGDYIQTDAVINTGSSGGALVSAEGKLIGINAAILSTNGMYAGYGFAIPVNLVRKVVAEFIKTSDLKYTEPVKSSTAQKQLAERNSFAQS
jgi:serine protease Do